ncbi:MAG: mechanosensitive ion channel [Candidatus Omnitrophica bacterium]|nr:mechanosensitive ion channel [Candidatus Omnitrophota bacterium]
MAKISKSIVWEIAKKSAFPLILLILLIGGYVFYKKEIAAAISAEYARSAAKYAKTMAIICVTFIAQRVIGAVTGWYKENIAAKTRTGLDDKLMPFLRRALKTAAWIIAFVVILPVYGVSISALIATLGVSSLAIALAAQDTIANIISGFLIMIDAPFQKGDTIKLPSGDIVKVLDIGVRRSKFLSKDNATVIVPNVNLSKQQITNYTYKDE